MIDRTTVLNSLIRLDRPIGEIRAELSTFPWDSPSELVTLTAEDIRSVLTRFTSGTLTASEVSEWADAIELREDIAFEARYHEEIVDAIFFMADPQLNGPLNQNEISRLVALLSK